ncbi:hypothetical protein ARC20_03245 [Stenotrophomonas panacihumi]|uniref:Uncharacterized protein n=1 Tax=Stenotrophomonas panacihumi TaxID=676599 RepID=A0A0R0AQ55_9GAMM|nr:hypothetical protein [Stenotrophomonas panacihumi]KRG47359.1 hypothetical protein ARC20_03245 [Stenotrophomonas panacihumi]PTN55837.1 hypothetical protein C9J98_04485 [Stenotrophomonas panacihumi]
MTTSKRKPKLSAVNHLQGVLTVLDGKTKLPTAEVLTAIREMVSDALAVLQEPDPLKRRIAFVLLAVQESTEVNVREVRGKRITRVTVVDQPLYHWALEEIHALAGAA